MRSTVTALVAAVSLGVASSAAMAAELIVNGGFEDPLLAGWTTVNELGSDGSFLPQTGTSSPVNFAPVPAPPEGTRAAMTDAMGPGSRVMYQDFVVPVGVSSATLSFERYVNNQANDFYVPAPDSLVFSGPDLNQQARVDLMTTTSDPFSVAPGDVLLNVFQTPASSPLVSGYSTVTLDVTGLLAAQAGQTLRLRFAAVDNVFIFNFGVDRVSLAVDMVPTPGGAAGAVPLLAALASSRLARRRRSAR